MPTINVKVKDKIASLVNAADYIICGNSDYTINFTFDEEWSSYTVKTARFVTDDGYQEVTFNGTSCNAPKISNALGVRVGVYAGNLHTTTPAFINTKKSILCGNGTHVTPPTDVYNQLVAAIDEVADDKVDKVAGKGLSTNDYTTAEKTKLEGIEAGAEANVQSDWNASSGDAAILNKPAIPSKTSDLQNDSGFLTDAPSDNKEYARKNGSWSEVQGGGGSVSWNDVTDKPSTFPPSTHTHDDRYYTEAEVDALLDEKADSDDIPTKTSELENDSGFLTEHQSLSGYATESWVENKGYGTYSKPSGGIPSSDMTSAIQASLNKADTALQEHQSLAAYRTSAAQDLIDAGKADDSDLTDHTDNSNIHVTASDKATWTAKQDAIQPNTYDAYGAATSAVSAHNSAADAHSSLFSAKQNVISDLETIRSGASAGATAYQKPSGGIPSSDMTSAVQTSLGKADSAIQEHQSLSAYRTSAAQDIIDNGKLPTSQKGAANGLAELDATGHVPSSQLPSYVDDVLEYASTSAFPATGETGKIYIATDTNLSYRWTGTGYAEISPSIALGETSSTAYRGDRGKTAYDHSQDSTVHVTASQKTTWDAKGTYSKPSGGIPKTDLASDVQTSLGKADSALQSHQSLSAYRTASAQDTIDAGKVDKVSGKGLSTNDYTTAEKNKLAGIAAGAEVNVQSDWNATSGDALILNKPTLATVATSGSYNDLSNKPTIPAAVTESTVSGWGFTKNAGTITGITMNGASKGTSGVVDLGTVLTAHQSLSNYYTQAQVNALIPTVTRL